ncbi:MAG: NusG domain II-containing protein [Eubacteriales bacterium]|nr:NusG domain II-containing protein [Eubacteriales bacterium]
MKKKDILLICGVLLLALSAFFASRLFAPQGSNAEVTVYVGGEIYAKVLADDYQTITIDQGDGKVNVVVIDESGVRMEHSTCKNQICVRRGIIDPRKADELLLDRWIVCLPNGVTVEVTGAEDGR